MSRSPDERFSDILAAIERCLECRAHLDAEDVPLAAWHSMPYSAIRR
ncbi:hypothetical protein GSU68_10035 [Rathayibacter sp. VKM Ac-2759]|nr:hypothetical protein [Rathayibacter sp. VKM Ac-2759]QHC66867.1 hypothetical protein GSU68_10035 [Rathayibacter sp. VKM Ac-2759]